MLQSAFLGVLRISAAVSPVILTLLVLKSLLKKRYGVKWRYTMWLILALCLFLPLDMPLFRQPLPVSLPASFVETGRKAQEWFLVSETTLLPASAPDEVKSPSVSAGISPVPTYSIGQIASVLWISGMLIKIFTMAAANMHFRRQIKRHARAPKAPATLAAIDCASSSLHIKRRPTPKPLVLIYGMAQGPLLTGLLRPLLLLPHENYNRETLDYILRHELIHYKRRDLIYTFLIWLAATVHWFNPIVALMVRQARQDMELSCDLEVTAFFNPEETYLYGKTILSNSTGAAPGFILSTSFKGEKNMLKKRLENLYDKKRKKKGVIALILSIALVATSGILVSCTQASETTNEILAEQPLQPAAKPTGETALYRAAQEQSPVAISTAPVAEAAWEQKIIDGKTWRLVSNETQLRSIAFNADTLSKNYLQIENIELTGPWIPIGTENSPFTGCYSGNGYHIGGLDFTDAGQCALFGGLQGVVYNVNLFQPKMNGAYAREGVEISINTSGSVMKNNLIMYKPEPLQNAVLIDFLVLSFYDSGEPYIKENITNYTDKTIMDFEFTYLAYDKAGNPLAVDWNPFGNGDKTYENVWQYDIGSLYDDGSNDIPPGNTMVSRGGWSLNESWFAENNEQQIAYAIGCFKSITFRDGSTWQNPAYQQWLSRYKGVKTAVEDLESYFPYVHYITE